MVLTALVKLADRFSEESLARINALLAPFETSIVLQAQERACEYAELLKEDCVAVRETVLDRMPPLDIDNAKARRAEEEASGESDEESEEEEQWVCGAVLRVGPPSPPSRPSPRSLST